MYVQSYEESLNVLYTNFKFLQRIEYISLLFHALFVNYHEFVLFQDPEVLETQPSFRVMISIHHSPVDVKIER